MEFAEPEGISAHSLLDAGTVLRTVRAKEELSYMRYTSIGRVYCRCVNQAVSGFETIPAYHAV